MNFDASGENYPDRRGLRPALTLDDDSSFQLSRDTSNPVFYHHLRVEEDDLFFWETPLDLRSQLPRGYGVGLSLRNLDCIGAASCDFFSLGALRIHYEKQASEIHCSVHGAGAPLATTSLRWTPGSEIEVFCNISDNQLQIYSLDQRPSSVPFNTFGVYNQSALELQLGKLRASSLAGRFRGEVGRLQYWRDPNAMP